MKNIVIVFIVTLVLTYINTYAQEKAVASDSLSYSSIIKFPFRAGMPYIKPIGPEIIETNMVICRLEKCRILCMCYRFDWLWIQRGNTWLPKSASIEPEIILSGIPANYNNAQTLSITEYSYIKEALPFKHRNYSNKANLSDTYASIP